MAIEPADTVHKGWLEHIYIHRVGDVARGILIGGTHIYHLHAVGLYGPLKGGGIYAPNAVGRLGTSS